MASGSAQPGTRPGVVRDKKEAAQPGSKSANFAGFPPEGIAFLRSLKKNNNREWFNAHKAVFEEKVRKPMIALVEAVHAHMLRYAPDYVGDPAKCVFRIYRDTRFSKDKTPYKTYVSAVLWRNDLGKDCGAGFYFYVSPEETGVACGLYNPDPEQLFLVRRAIADDYKSFQQLIANRRVKRLFGELEGPALSRPPKGFEPDHPAIDLIKRKSFVLHAKLDPAIAITPQLCKEITARIEAGAPFVRFLNAPLGEQSRVKKRDEAFLR